LSTKRYVRLVATYAGDKSTPQSFREAQPADSSLRVYFDVLLEGQHIVPMRYFGLLTAGHDKYPAVLEPPTADGKATIDLGVLNEEAPLATNLFQKEIVVNELFTVSGAEMGAGTFRVVELRQLL